MQKNNKLSFFNNLHQNECNQIRQQVYREIQIKGQFVAAAQTTLSIIHVTRHQ